MIKNFARGRAPLTAQRISRELEIPIRLVNEILFELVRSRLFSVSGAEGDGEQEYQPARDIQLLTIQYVIETLELCGLNTIPFARTPEFSVLSKTVEAFGKAIETLPENRLLKDV